MPYIISACSRAACETSYRARACSTESLAAIEVGAQGSRGIWAAEWPKKRGQDDGEQKNVGDVGDVGDLRAFCPVFAGFWLPARLAMLATFNPRLGGVRGFAESL